MGYRNRRLKKGNTMARVYFAAIMCLAMWTVPMPGTAQEEAAKEKSESAADQPPTQPADQPAAGTPAPEQGGDTAVESGTSPADPPAASTDSGKAEMGAYTVKLRDLEDRINRLKEQIFRSKARLSLLAETVLDRKIAGAKAKIVFRNEMGGSFKLVKAVVLLDGGPIFNKSDEGGSLAEREILNLFDGPVMPGEHTLSVVLQYRGHGYGIFSYLRGYQFKTKSSRTFTVNEGKAIKMEVVGYEKGGATTPLEERPDIRYIMNVVDYEDDALTEDEEDGKE